MSFTFHRIRAGIGYYYLLRGEKTILIDGGALIRLKNSCRLETCGNFFGGRMFATPEGKRKPLVRVGRGVSGDQVFLYR